MISFDELCNISEYAKAHYESSKDLYLKRNQNPKNAFQNILQGKISEFCAYYYLVSKGEVLDKPDLKVYGSNKKSYDCDLYIKNKDIHIHVKGITIFTRENYGNSFLIEKNDPLYLNPKPNHYIMVMHEINYLNYYCHKWIKATECQYSKPILNLPTKAAVYL